jgi:hypothetical protein
MLYQLSQADHIEGFRIERKVLRWCDKIRLELRERGDFASYYIERRSIPDRILRTADFENLVLDANTRLDPSDSCVVDN